MKAKKTVSVALLSAGAALLAAGCSEKAAVEAKSAEAEDCRTTPPAELTHMSYMCALAAETQAMADTLATIVDRASADRATPVLRKIAARIEAVKKEAPRLNNDPKAGGKGAVSSLKMPALAKASRAYLDEFRRLAREHPDLVMVIGPAMETKD